MTALLLLASWSWKTYISLLPASDMRMQSSWVVQSSTSSVLMFLIFMVYMGAELSIDYLDLRLVITYSRVLFLLVDRMNTLPLYFSLSYMFLSMFTLLYLSLLWLYIYMYILTRIILYIFTITITMIYFRLWVELGVILWIIINNKQIAAHEAAQSKCFRPWWWLWCGGLIATHADR